MANKVDSALWRNVLTRYNFMRRNILLLVKDLEDSSKGNLTNKQKKEILSFYALIIKRGTPIARVQSSDKELRDLNNNFSELLVKASKQEDIKSAIRLLKFCSKILKRAMDYSEDKLKKSKESEKNLSAAAVDSDSYDKLLFSSIYISLDFSTKPFTYNALPIRQFRFIDIQKFQQKIWAMNDGKIHLFIVSSVKLPRQKIIKALKQAIIKFNEKKFFRFFRDEGKLIGKYVLGAIIRDIGLPLRVRHKGRNFIATEELADEQLAAISKFLSKNEPQRRSISRAA